MTRRRSQVGLQCFAACLCGDVGRGGAGLGPGGAEQGRAGQGGSRQVGGQGGAARRAGRAARPRRTGDLGEQAPHSRRIRPRRKILLDLQRPDLAEKLLQKALDANPSDAELADLARQFGLKTFLDFATDPGIGSRGASTGRRGLDGQREGDSEPQAAGRVDPEAARPVGRDPRRRQSPGLGTPQIAGVEALVAVLADPAAKRNTTLVRRP